MINTYRYGGSDKVEKDGKKSIVQILPSVVLNQMGAFIKVTITHPRIVQENFKEQGKSTPTVSVNALIDTGASGTVITPHVADQLRLIQTGFQKVSSVQDEQQRPVYYGFIIFPWGSGKEIPIVSCPLKNFDCLIGRDVLLHWHFTYNGPDGSVVICD
ncbi:MAG: aspartyl protease family protein [Candidatus Marinimicrobia bacterium]|nr:aspartyl protease family protein [Candidatus Neomarinimicrobiota bacterium]